MNKDKNSLALAYLGDAVYEIYIREYLINKGISKVNDLQKAAVKFVSAKSQTMYLTKMIDENILTEEELEIVYRARNHKTKSHPKNTDIITYKYATGLEALFGVLYLDKNISRIEELIKYILGE